LGICVVSVDHLAGSEVVEVAGLFAAQLQVAVVEEPALGHAGTRVAD
jgi:hypothetical protein